MKNHLLPAAVLTFILVFLPSASYGIIFIETLCDLDHNEATSEFPDLPDKIGEYAGFQILGLFLSKGGFGCPENIQADIRQMNVDYQDEYLPRYAEAVEIQTWMEAAHVITVPPSPPTICPICGVSHTNDEFKAMALAKVARRNEISSEIDAIATGLMVDAWEMVPDESRTAYLAWINTLTP